MKHIWWKPLVIFCGLLLSCGNNGNKQQVKESKKDADTINCTILNVSLSDNRTFAKTKLTEQGYHWEENDMWIEVIDEVIIGGYKFDNVTYLYYNAKIWNIQIRREFDSEESARNFYNELNVALNGKYASFKTNDTDENSIEYTEFCDTKTSIRLILDYHPQEKIIPWYSEELKRSCKEYWSVEILYDIVNSKSKSSNDF